MHTHTYTHTHIDNYCLISFFYFLHEFSLNLQKISLNFFIIHTTETIVVVYTMSLIEEKKKNLNEMSTNN